MSDFINVYTSIIPRHLTCVRGMAHGPVHDIDPMDVELLKSNDSEDKTYIRLKYSDITIARYYLVEEVINDFVTQMANDRK